MTTDVDTILDMVQSVTGKAYNRAEVSASTSFLDDLSLTSIQTVDLIMAIEEKFGVEIEDVDLGKLRTIGQTIAYIQDKTS
jgi:acyl carrier protein